MPVMRYTLVPLSFITALAFLAVGTNPAAADYTPGSGAQESVPDPDVSGDAKDDGTLSATAGAVVFDRSKNGKGSQAGSVAPAGNWLPPACWYAPKYTAKQLKKEREHTWGLDSTGAEFESQEQDRYVKGHPYKDFNLDKAGKGYWWGSYVNESFPAGWDACGADNFWVDKGDPPPADVPQAVTPEVLAKLAYAEIRVPGTEVTLSPEGDSKVNLPTWVWLDKAEFKPVSVTARVPVLGIQATTTATLKSLTLEPGTEDATLYPASGECPIKKGSIGTPYTKGSADKDPPCGLTYLRDSGDGSYPLRATITWEIHWTGTGVAGQKALPEGRFGTTQNIAVGEIQAINR